MHTRLDYRLMVLAVSLMVAGAACASPAGQPTQAEMTSPAVLVPETAQVEMTSPPVEVTATAAPTEQATEAPTTEAAAAGGERTITAGAKIAVFGPYTIVAPADWKDTHQVAEGVVDTLLLQKGGDVLMISQAAGGGGECGFDGTGEPMGQVFPSGVEITGGGTLFKRGTNDGGQNWTVCEKGPDTFGFPTNYGYITYKGAAAIGDAALAEMDAMVMSLRPQQ